MNRFSYSISVAPLAKRQRSGFKDKLPAMSEEEQNVLLVTDGMLVKRPLPVVRIKFLWDLKKKIGKKVWHII